MSIWTPQRESIVALLIKRCPRWSDYIRLMRTAGFYRERVFAMCQLWGSFDGSALHGMIAFRDGWIDQLSVLPDAQGRGAGTELLDVAKRAFDRLQLWTFQGNVRARRFYEARGFVLAEETDGKRNEEKEPDARYVWLAATA